ncbi:MAG TPA: zinc-binding dehydrogenase [Kofleriaceae bacterium]|nr:zinc-binding dehydrogenase [Kofleriaceae bacterium]
MRAIVVRSVGDPSVLVEETVADPAPAPGEVLVRIAACGVNFADTEGRRAVYRMPAMPWIPGHEAAGVVEAVGEGVDASLRGRRVAFFSTRSSGTYAELATAPADELFVFGETIDFATMAGVPLQGLTAVGVLRLAGPVAGRTVLVHAAAGGVGQLLVQLARREGARVLGLASTPVKVEIVRALGIEASSSSDDWVAWAGEVDVVFDSVGRATRDGSLRVLAPGGQLLFFGDASGPPAPIDVDELYAKSLRVGAFTLDVSRARDAWARARLELTRAVTTGELRVNVTRTFPLRDAAAAHAAIESRATSGKLVLVP